MKKGERYEGIVERIEFPNKGIILIDEIKIIVKNAIPGQKVAFSIAKKRKGKAEGRLLEVLERSPLETEEGCPHFGECGGCTYQTLPYDEQLKIKEGQVRALLDEVFINANEKPEYGFEGIKGSPCVTEYRNKMEFSFGDEVKDGPLALGMHKRGSFYDIVTVDRCQIVDEDYRLILKTVHAFFQKKQAKFYHKMRHEGYLRHLLVRKGKKTGDILIALVTSTQKEEIENSGGESEEAMLQSMGEEILNLDLTGDVVGILHVKNDSLSDVVKNDDTIVLYGQDMFYDELLGLKFSISPFSFFQTNSLGAEVLYDTVREYVDFVRQDAGREGKKEKVIFDLYSGTGTIAQILAPIADEVVGVEIVEEAVEAAKENAKLNGLTNCRFIAGDVLKVIDELEEKPDLIVLDPPRDGLHPKALVKIIELSQCPNIIYISCKPTSLVRDLVKFREYGYEVRKSCCVDLFPGTPHVEVIIMMQYCGFGKK